MPNARRMLAQTASAQAASSPRQAEELAIQLVDEIASIARTKHRHQGAPGRIRGRRARAVPARERDEVAVQLLAGRAIDLEQHCGPQRPGLTEERG